MKGLKVKKEVAEQIKGKLKEPENSIFDMDFVEKLQNKQVKSKLQANKTATFDDMEDIEKGIRTVVVPPSNGRKGYQYNRVFPSNKNENHYLPKKCVDKEEQKLRVKIKNISESQTKAEKSLIKSDIKNCTSRYEYENVSIPIHPSRLPEKQNKYDRPKTIVELKVAGIFKKKGFDIYIPKERHNEQKKKNVDFIIDGVRFELKTVSGNLNTTQQRYSDALDQSKNIILSFKSKKDVPDFMRKQAALNGARLTNKKQQCLIFVFEKEKEISFYDTSKIKKSILISQDAVNGEPLSSKNVGISPTFLFSHIYKDLSSKFVQKSTYPDYSGESKMKQTFDINITDITEGNKQRKLEQFSKALNAMADNRPFVIKHIPADGSTKYNNLVVRIRDFDRSKIEKAVHKVALSLDSNVKAASKGESFVYKTQEEITENFYSLMTEKAKAIYDFVIGYFDLPDIRIVSKAGELKYKGKVLYNPETGMPIKDSEWKKFVAELEKLLNRNYDGVGDKIVLSAESLGMILERLSKTNSFEAIKKMSLSDLKAKRYDVDWISESVKNMKDKFGDAVSRERQARIQIAMDSAAQRVTRVKDDMRNNIQQIVIDGIRDKQSKSVVAQNLFDKCASLNRDMQRIADSEIQMAANSAYCKEEVYNSKPGEKVYFKRFEIIDDNTCKQCKKLNGTVVLWSDVPLPDEHIKDPYAKYAIWDGKNEGSCPVGIVHPFCRGTWVRYYPEA